MDLRHTNCFKRSKVKVTAGGHHISHTNEGNFSQFWLQMYLHAYMLITFWDQNPSPSKNADFDRFQLITSQPQEIAKNAIMANRKSSRAFQRAIDGVRMLIRKSPKGWLKNRFFGIKFNFTRVQSATKFRCVKTLIGVVLEQSISYEITEKIGRKVFLST